MANEAASCTATLQIPLRDTNGVTTQDIVCTWPLTTPVELQNYVTLSAGNTDIRPSIGGLTYQLLIIVPPPGVADTWKLKGVAGDTGFPISCTFPTFIPSPGSSALLLNAVSGGYTILTRWFR